MEVMATTAGVLEKKETVDFLETELDMLPRSSCGIRFSGSKDRKLVDFLHFL